MTSNPFYNTESAVEVGLEAAIRALQDTQNGRSKSLKAFDQLAEGMKELGISQLSELKRRSVDAPHSIVNDFWTLSRVSEANNSLRGVVFEHLIELILAARGVLPLYTQVTLSMVPNVRFDLVAFPATNTQEALAPATGPAPICISLKTSLRERYKQAELEAAAVRGVYRWATCFLVTLDAEAAKTVNAKIDKREVMFLEPVVVAGSPDFDDFVDRLSFRKMIESPQIAAIHSNFTTIQSGGGA